jgi:hypothetical protein
MAGGATITGTVGDGTQVDVIGEAEFLGRNISRSATLRTRARSTAASWI